LTVRHRFLNYFMIRQNDELAMRERVGKDIWKGLYDFYLMESPGHVGTPDELDDNPVLHVLLQKGRISEVPRLYTHILTHQRLNVRFWWIDFQSGHTIDLPPGMAFYTKEQIEILPKPILIDTLLKEEDYL
jgi:A/G-specific adenine glycosylase